MKSVDDLNSTVSMENFKASSNEPIKINAMDSETIQGADRPTIRITANRPKPTRRTITDPSELQQVDLSKIEKAPAPKVESHSFQETAMTALDRAVARKRQEFQDFIEKATAEDEINRARIEDGLDEVSGELNYLPDELKKSRENDSLDKFVRTPVIDEIGKDIEDDFSDIEKDIEEDLRPTQTESTAYGQYVVEDPFADRFTQKVVREEFEEVTEEMEEVEEIPEDVIEESQSVEEIEDPIQEVLVEEKAEEHVYEEKVKTIDQKITEDITSGSIEVRRTIDADPSTIASSSSSDFDLAEEDFEDVTYAGENPDNLTDDQILEISNTREEEFKNEIIQKIIKASKTLDTKSFVVSNKVISLRDAVKNKPAPIERTAKWPLMFAGRPFVAKALKGPEISLLADTDDSNSDNPIGLTIPQARIMYEHDANPYKPGSVESWAKTIPFSDVENIFAALYVASLKGANYIPMACSQPSCQYSYLTDDLDIKKMVTFSSDKTKSLYDDIMKMELTADDTGKYNSVISVINDEYAVGIKIPSIYTILYEYGSLNAEFIRKYSTVVSIIQYIDYIYLINPNTQQFEPIGWKSYPGDYAKTFKSKIATYAKILKEFDDTDFSVMIALITSMVSKTADEKGLTYKIPATTCPKCGAEIPERNINPRGLVFMRQRLVELATTPTEK